MIKRYYINITNACNRDCPFCCMYSSSKNSQFMTMEQFKSIINNTDEKIELQLEGGEPVIHPLFYDFVRYAFENNRILNLCVLTNGVAFNDAAKFLKQIANKYKINVLIKVSFNYYLDSFKDHFDTVKQMCIDNPNDEWFKIIGNVRFRPDNPVDKALIDKINADDIISQVCKDRCWSLQHYGKAKNDKNLSDIIIVCRDIDYHLFSSDALDFGKDLVKRSEHEGEITK